MQLEFIKRQRWPVIDANVSYGYSRSTSEAGFLQSNQNYGLTYGAGLRFNLFNGFNYRRQKQNAQIQLENSELMNEQLTQELNASLVSTYNDYESVLELLELEQENVKAAAENLELGLARYKQGMISGIEFREIQLNHIIARNKVNNLLYQAKVAETMLLRLSGGLWVE